MFILKISNSSDISQEEIARLIRVHKTPQEEVLVIRTAETLPRGFVITREDRFLENVIKDTPEAKSSANFTEILFKQKDIIRKEKEVAERKISKSV